MSQKSRKKNAASQGMIAGFLFTLMGAANLIVGLQSGAAWFAWGGIIMLFLGMSVILLAAHTRDHLDRE